MAKDYDDLRNNESPFTDDMDYKELMDSAASRGDMESAAQYETWRNDKLDRQGNSDAKTYAYTTPDGSYRENETAATPEEIAAAKSSGSGSGSTNFSYGNASSWLSNTDSQINKLAKSLLNRDAFSYDAAKDPLYQQYADQYTLAGDRAMQDTLGEVSARTGGLASSYATGASQGAYNSYMQQLAAKVPELYSLAYSMYQDEGDRQLSNLNMLRGLQSDDYTQYSNDRSFAASQAQQTKENQWTEEQIARGVKQDVLEAAMSNSLSQSEWETKRAQYLKTGKGGADVANYETYFDYMTGLTDYYAERLR